jgi:hypothetical protein
VSSPESWQYAGGSKQTFTAYGGTPDSGLSIRDTNRLEGYYCSISKDYSYSGEDVALDGSRRLISRFTITGLAAGSCNFELSTSVDGSYLRKSMSIVIWRQTIPTLSASGTVGKTFYPGQTVDLKTGLTVGSDQVPRYSGSGACTVTNGVAEMQESGRCSVLIETDASLVYTAFSYTYGISVSPLAEQYILVGSIPETLSISKGTYSVGYCMSRYNYSTSYTQDRTWCYSDSDKPLIPTFTSTTPEICSISRGFRVFNLTLRRAGICSFEIYSPGSYNFAPSNKLTISLTLKD